jgi:hypothetical protein
MKVTGYNLWTELDPYKVSLQTQTDYEVGFDSLQMSIIFLITFYWV